LAKFGNLRTNFVGEEEVQEAISFGEIPVNDEFLIPLPIPITRSF